MSSNLLKIASILLAIIVFINTFTFITTANNSIESQKSILNNEGKNIIFQEYSNSFNKLHIYFKSENFSFIDNINELEEALSDIFDFCNKNQSYQTVEITIQFKSDYMTSNEYNEASKAREKISNTTELREFRIKTNKISKEYHRNLVESHLDILSNINYISYDIIGYSPFITIKINYLEITAEMLYTLIDNSDVLNISIDISSDEESKVVPEVSWENTLTAISASSIVNNGTYTGDGIYIGIYEANGICDVNHVNLSDKNITVRNSSYSISSHATGVTSVAALMAPDADYFIDMCNSTNPIGIEWFIDEACDVVNCSFGAYYNILNPDGTYTLGSFGYKYDYDGVYDYQIIANFISVVVSAGNYCNDNTKRYYNPDRKISTPGYAYNAITVGGANRTYKDGAYRLIHYGIASYQCTSPKIKPNVSAIAIVTIPNIGIVDGTSYAAPQVTACAAMMMESVPLFATYIELITSQITSTAKTTYDYTADVGNFDNKLGAGVINLNKMITSSNYIKFFNYNLTGGVIIKDISVSLTSNANLQVGLSWLVTPVNSSGSGINITSINVTNYNLRIYDPGGNIVKSSNLLDSNVELIRYTVPTSGVYRIVIYQLTNQDPANNYECLALTYNY